MRTTDDGYEVRDAILDPLFAQYPLVTGEPHIRFYAGAPLLLPWSWQANCNYWLSWKRHRTGDGATGAGNRLNLLLFRR